MNLKPFFRKFIINPSSIIFLKHHRCVKVRKEELVKSAGVTAYLSLLAEVTGDWCVFGKGELWPPRWCEHPSNRGSLVAIIEDMIYVISGLKASCSPLTTSILLGGWRQTLICRDIDGYPYSKRSLKNLITVDVVLGFFAWNFRLDHFSTAPNKKWGYYGG